MVANPGTVKVLLDEKHVQLAASAVATLMGMICNCLYTCLAILGQVTA
jgi:hypothetical protein